MYKYLKENVNTVMREINNAKKNGTYRDKNKLR